VANAQTGILEPEEYAKFSEPFDKQILQRSPTPRSISSTSTARRPTPDTSFKATGWKVSGMNYSLHESGYSMRLARHNWHTIHGALVGGIDHRTFRIRSVEELREDVRLAVLDAGKRLIVTPGLLGSERLAAGGVAASRRGARRVRRLVQSGRVALFQRSFDRVATT